MLDLVKNSKVFRATSQQGLQGALVAGWEKEGELATTSLKFEFHLQFPFGSPSTELPDFCQSAQSRNEHKCKKHFKTCAKGKDVITNIISTNQHFASTFLMQLFKFQRRSCKLSFLSLPCCQSVLESLLTGYVNKHVANTENARIILTHASHFLVHFLRWMEDMTTWREIFLPLLDLACHP